MNKKIFLIISFILIFSFSLVSIARAAVMGKSSNKKEKEIKLKSTDKFLNSNHFGNALFFLRANKIIKFENEAEEIIDLPIDKGFILHQLIELKDKKSIIFKEIKQPSYQNNNSSNFKYVSNIKIFNKTKKNSRNLIKDKKIKGLFSISENEDKIVYANDKGIYLYDICLNRDNKISDFGNNPEFMNEKKIVFYNEEGVYYIDNIDEPMVNKIIEGKIWYCRFSKSNLICYFRNDTKKLCLIDKYNKKEQTLIENFWDFQKEEGTEIMHFSISPNGQWVAYTLETYKLKQIKNSSEVKYFTTKVNSDIWIISTKNPEEKRKITNTDSIFESNPIWLSDNKTLVYRENSNLGETVIKIKKVIE